jgi:hypothetical protein
MDEDRDTRKKAPPRNVAVVRHAIEEIWNQRNLGMADDIFTAEYVNTGGLIPDLVRGPEAIKVAAALHHTAFPRLHVTIELMIAEGALVAFQWVARNVIDGDARDSDSTPVEGTLRGTTFCRLAAGKIVESWTSWDSSSLLRKLARAAGLVPGRDTRVPSGLN